MSAYHEPMTPRRWLKTPQFMWALIVIAAALGWFLAGVLGLVVVLIAGLVVAAQRQSNPFRNWQTGRPWRPSQARGAVFGPGDRAGPGPDEPGAIEEWIRERSMYDLPEESGDD
jgi:hypothetical protein